MEDRRCQGRIGTGGEAVDHVARVPDAARRDHRHVDRGRDRPQEREVVAVLRAVAVHRGEQDLARPALHALARPGERVAAGRRPAPGDDHLPAAGARAGIDGQHDALRAEHVRKLPHELRPRHRRRVDRHLVGAGVEHRLGVGDRADAAADGERHEHLVGRAPRQLHHGRALVRRRRDVEEDELIGALAVVERRQLDRIARVADVDETRALHDAARVDVHAGDHALVVHAPLTLARPSDREERPRGAGDAVLVGAAPRFVPARNTSASSVETASVARSAPKAPV